MGFHPGTLHGYFFHKHFWPNLNFPLEHQIKLVLTSKLLTKECMKRFGDIRVVLRFYQLETYVCKARELV